MKPTAAQRKALRRRFHAIPHCTVGVEWEMNCKQNTKYASTGLALYQASWNGDNVGTDGSLDSFNFEVASKIHHAKDFLFKGLEKWRRKFINYKRLVEMRPDNYAGVHIHIGLKHFTMAEVAKIVLFVNTLEPHLTALGGGNVYNNYADFVAGFSRAGITISHVAHRLIRLILFNPLNKVAKGYNRDRANKLATQRGFMATKYLAMNIHDSYPTMEFRFPRTTKQFNIFLARVQLIIAICSFCRSGISFALFKPKEAANYSYYKSPYELISDSQDTLWGAFCLYVNNNKKAFHYLYDLMKQTRTFLITKKRFNEVRYQKISV